MNPNALLGRDIDPSGKELYLTAVTSDSVHEGAVAGEWLAKTIGDKSCNVVELQGTVGASVATNRKKGFDSVVAKHANLSIDAVPDIFKAMAAGEANATVALTPNMAGPVLDAISAYKEKGTAPLGDQ